MINNNLIKFTPPFIKLILLNIDIGCFY